MGVFIGKKRGTGVTRVTLGAGAAAVALMLGACGGSSSSSTPKAADTPAAAGASSSAAAPAESASPAAGASGGGAAAIDAAYAQDLKGTWTAPPTDPSPAVPGKKIMVISCGQANDNCTDMGIGAVGAAKAIGWTMILCDGQLNPAKASECFRQAVAQHVDGIVNESWDCPIVKAPLQAAVDAGIKVVPLHAFDCGEIKPGDKNLFNVNLNYGDFAKNQPDAWRAWGAASAIAALKNAKGGAILYPDDTAEYASFKYQAEGWYAKVKEVAPSTKVVSMPWTVSEVGAKLEAKTQATLLKNPDITAVATAVNPALGFRNGVRQSGKAGKIALIEGHGSATEASWVRDGSMTALIGWPADWWGYGAFDALNSAFANKPQSVIGIGIAIIDKDHNLPPAGKPFVANSVGIDLDAAYRKRWGK